MRNRKQASGLAVFALISSFAFSADQFSGCFDPMGNSVQTVSRDQAPVAAAAITNKDDDSSVIVVNQKWFKTLKAPTRSVIYWHECGHVALAHNLRGEITPVQEQEADCHGVCTALTLGQISVNDLPAIEKDFAALGPGDWQHLSGSARAVNLERCLGNIRTNFASCKREYDANLELMRNSIPTLNDMVAICNKFGKKSAECNQAGDLTNTLHQGILKTIGILDNQCPCISDPQFSKVMAQFQTARLKLQQARGLKQ